MDREQFLNLLKDALNERLALSIDRDDYGQRVVVKVMFCGEVVAEDFFYDWMVMKS